MGDEWRPEFEPLYEALRQVAADPIAAYEEAGKFLGLLVWNEALNHRERWHFTKYPKDDGSDLLVTWYFSWEAHICATVKFRQAANARDHGDEERAVALEEAARALQTRWGHRQ